MQFNRLSVVTEHQKIEGERLVSESAFGLALLLATLWDFYSFKMRWFDAPLFVLIAALFVIQTVRDRRVRIWRPFLPLICVLLVYSIFGFIRFHHRSSAAIAILPLVVFLTASLPVSREVLAKTLRLIIVFHIAAFLLQWCLKICFGYVLDYHALYGSASRITHTLMFRGSGLFQEPNSYCMNMFLLLSLAIQLKERTALVICAVFSMLLSQSLWGIGASGLLLAMHAWNKRSSISSRLRALTLYGLLSGVPFALFLLVSIPDGYHQPPLLERILQLPSDGGLTERYIHNNILQEKGLLPPFPPAPKEEFQLPPIVQVLSGSGLSTHYFQSKLPSNGFSLIYKSCGILGSLLLLIGLWGASAPLSRHARGIALLSTLFALTNYPQFTYTGFWLWFALIMRPWAEGEASPQGTNDRIAKAYVHPLRKYFAHE